MKRLLLSRSCGGMPQFGILAVTALAIIACDHPTGIATLPPAGSFESFDCGVLVESPSGGIYTLEGGAPSPLNVKSRSADGQIIGWSTGLPTSYGQCKGAVGPSGNLLVGTTDSVYSLNARNGAIRWRFAAKIFDIATSASGKVFVSARAPNANVSEIVYALSDSDGSLLWSRTLSGIGGLFVDDVRSTLYAVQGHVAIAMDLATGAVKWETSPEANFGSQAAIASDGSLLVATTLTTGFFGRETVSTEIHAYDVDGARKWRTANLSPRLPIGPPVIDESGTVYLAASYEFSPYVAAVYAFSGTSGEIKWKHDFFRIHSANIAVAADRTVYVIAQATADSAYQVYGLRDGTIVSAVTPVEPDYPAPITIHSNKLLYYGGHAKIGFFSTAGVNPSAAWPMDKHDARRSARR